MMPLPSLYVRKLLKRHGLLKFPKFLKIVMTMVKHSRFKFKIQILFFKTQIDFPWGQDHFNRFLLSILFFAIFGGHKAQLKIWLRLTARWHYSSPNPLKSSNKKTRVRFFFSFFLFELPVMLKTLWAPSDEVVSLWPLLATANRCKCSNVTWNHTALKWYYDENWIFPIKAIWNINK